MFRTSLLGGVLVFAAALFAAPASAQVNGLPQVAVCGNTQATGANCLQPNSNGSLPVSGGTTAYSTTDRGGTLTSGGAAQNAMASNSSRKIWCIQNDPDESEVMTVRLNGTASATTGTVLSPGAQACSTPGYTDTAAVSVFAATTGHRWFGFEGQ